MWNDANTKQPNGQRPSSESAFTEARCLICGRLIQENEQVLPILGIEVGAGVGYQLVVGEECIETFDDRVLAVVSAGFLEVDTGNGMVM